MVIDLLLCRRSPVDHVLNKPLDNLTISPFTLTLAKKDLWQEAGRGKRVGRVC